MSDARPEHLAGLIAQFEPLDEPGPDLHARIDTGKGSPDEVVREILHNSYKMKRGQVEQAIERL